MNALGKSLITSMCCKSRFDWVLHKTDVFRRSDFKETYIAHVLT